MLLLAVMVTSALASYIDPNEVQIFMSPVIAGIITNDKNIIDTYLTLFPRPIHVSLVVIDSHTLIEKVIDHKMMELQHTDSSDAVYRFFYLSLNDWKHDINDSDGYSYYVSVVDIYTGTANRKCIDVKQTSQVINVGEFPCVFNGFRIDTYVTAAWIFIASIAAILACKIIYKTSSKKGKQYYTNISTYTHIHSNIYTIKLYL